MRWQVKSDMIRVSNGIANISQSTSVSQPVSRGVSTSMGSCCVKQQLTEDDIKFLKKHTRYDEETIRPERHTQRHYNMMRLFQTFSTVFIYSVVNTNICLFLCLLLCQSGNGTQGFCKIVPMENSLRELSSTCIKCFFLLETLRSFVKTSSGHSMQIKVERLILKNF